MIEKTKPAGFKMEKLNRELQLKILNVLRGFYPWGVEFKEIANEFSGYEGRDIVGNVVYLGEHELIDVQSKPFSGSPVSGNKIKTSINPSDYLKGLFITKKGLDFIEDDGGLSAIIGSVVTVKFDADQLREILISRVSESAQSDDMKTQAIHQIRSLPASVLGKILDRLTEDALKNVPNLWSYLQTFL